MKSINVKINGYKPTKNHPVIYMNAEGDAIRVFERKCALIRPGRRSATSDVKVEGFSPVPGVAGVYVGFGENEGVLLGVARIARFIPTYGVRPMVRATHPGTGAPVSISVAENVMDLFGTPKPPGRHVLAFRDGNPENCRVANLYWRPCQETWKGDGTPTRRRLSPDEMVALRRSGKSLREVAEAAGLSTTHACRIINQHAPEG
jgi:hypothetical protein